ncbi:NAD-dependent epimerase/dehydratase family protein [Epibacterium sp. SM1979]|uniref:NAD-dependent epimerase/dehydratase family protein n=1 Tax=Tritonibacter litoralis TaxID=2662264 RepID=A0A843YK30_9RHOB|nr:NAD-dependent epimerase/dehydratase family protein [Tritonibacter litoralis]MQQ10178.1 NAD-dependent epimerase/dehydratase family protein [Tritonibacter litoralis]
MATNSNTTILLTGVTGYLGGHIALELLRLGYHVRGSMRDLARADHVRQALSAQGADLSKMTFVQLDLTQDAGWDEASTGADYLMHVASPFVTAMPKDKMQLIGPAVEGTERALQAALKAGVKRVVLTSSSVAIVNGRGASGPSELGPSDWADPESGKLNAYAESKTRAEMRAWEIMQAAGRGKDLTVINPGFILGPLLDEDPGTSGDLMRRMLNGEFPAVPDLYLHLIDVRDLARIHCAALTNEVTFGCRVPAAFEIQSLREFGDALKAALPERADQLPKLTLPNWAVRIYALFNPDIRANLVELGYHPSLDASRGQTLLKQDPVPTQDTIADMARSLAHHGLLSG